MAEEVGTAFVSIIPSMRGFSTLLKRELRQELALIDAPVAAAGARAGTSFASSMGARIGATMPAIRNVITTALLGAGAAAVIGLGAIAGFGLKSAASLEQTTIGFEALLGSATEAKNLLVELQQFAAETPFEFQGIADAGRRILAFGTSVGIARDEIIPTLTVIGDLVSVLGGTQESIDSVVRAFGQIASKGKVSQEELLQLAEALPGFNANAAIAAHLGLSVADSMQAITAGEVSAQEGIDGLLAGMRQFPGASGAMVKQSQTLLGVFSTFKDTLAITLTSAFQPVIPLVKDTLAELTPVVQGALQQLAPALGTLLGALLPVLGQLAQAITPVLVPLINGLAAGMDTLVSSGVLPELGAAIGDIITEIVPLAPLIAELAVELLRALIPVLVQLLPHLPAMVQAFAALVPVVAPLIPLIIELAKWVLLLSPVGLLLFTDEIAKFAFAVFSKLGGVLDFFRALPGKIGTFLAGLPAMLAGLARDAFVALAGAVGFGIGTVLKFFIDLPGNVASLVTELWARAKALFVGGVDGAVSTAKSLPGRVIDALRELPGRLASFATELAGKMFQLGRDIVQGAINGIKSLIGNIGSTLKDGFNSAVAGVKRGLGISSPSKVFADIGEDTVAGYVKGIEDSAKDARVALTATIGAAERRNTFSPTPAATDTPINVDNHIEIGGEVVRVVRTVVSRRDQDLRRRVLAGSGTR